MIRFVTLVVLAACSSSHDSGPGESQDGREDKGGDGASGDDTASIDGAVGVPISADPGAGGGDSPSGDEAEGAQASDGSGVGSGACDDAEWETERHTIECGGLKCLAGREACVLDCAVATDGGLPDEVPLCVPLGEDDDPIRAHCPGYYTTTMWCDDDEDCCTSGDECFHYAGAVYQTYACKERGVFRYCDSDEDCGPIQISSPQGSEIVEQDCYCEAGASSDVIAVFHCLPFPPDSPCL